eukprot:UN07701
MDCWEEFDENEMKTLVNDIMINCKNLNHFQIIIYYKQFEKMVSYMEIGLFNTRGFQIPFQNKRNEFCLDIEIWVEKQEKIKMDELNLLLLRMINMLNASQIVSFVLYCAFNWKDKMDINSIDNQEKQKIIEGFEDKYVVFWKTAEKFQYIAIKNKECKINGFPPHFIRYYDLSDLNDGDK